MRDAIRLKHYADRTEDTSQAEAKTRSLIAVLRLSRLTSASLQAAT
ncbi:MAG: hypothetical protein KME42_12030 [Tildeniella nuda ZEHNDER 1965/U140]|nr:hypothetical protein [Tildeniella nuda ZEHNDER 1965/U140]